MRHVRQVRDDGRRIALRAQMRARPAAQGLVTLDDHARLPWRFHGRFTASIVAGLAGA